MLTQIKQYVDLDDHMIQRILDRLESLGVVPADVPAFSIAFAIQKTEQYIKNFCNVRKIPEGLAFWLVNRVCGEVLEERLNSGGLQDVEQIVTSIKEGDTSVSFDSGSSKMGLIQSQIKALKGEDGELLCYRTIRW